MYVYMYVCIPKAERSLDSKLATALGRQHGRVVSVSDALSGFESRSGRLLDLFSAHSLLFSVVRSSNPRPRL